MAANLAVFRDPGRRSRLTVQGHGIDAVRAVEGASAEAPRKAANEARRLMPHTLLV
jgi:hypothetical protein